MTTTNGGTPKVTRRKERATERNSEGTPARPAALQPPTKSRRRPAVIAAGIALAIVGGLGSWYYASSVGNTTTVLTTKDTVNRGEEITTDDLATIEIAGGQGTTAFTAAQASDVVGMTATVDLPGGSLLTAENVGNAIAIENGQSIVGVALTVAQMPSYSLAAGDSIRLVDTPVAQGDPPATTPKSFEATVFTTRYEESTSQWIIDLVVSEDQAADIAARAATGRIALILDTAGE